MSSNENPSEDAISAAKAVGDEPTGPNYVRPDFCPKSTNGRCEEGPECMLKHWLQCAGCKEYCLNPVDLTQHERHRRKCTVLDLQADDTREVCMICYEDVKVLEKMENHRFAVLSGCTHRFCLTCILKWRSQYLGFTDFYFYCPACRVLSELACPTMKWVESEEERQLLVENFKDALGKMPCRSYVKRNGLWCPYVSCPFNHYLTDLSIPNIDADPALDTLMGKMNPRPLREQMDELETTGYIARRKRFEDDDDNYSEGNEAAELDRVLQLYFSTLDG